MSTSASGAPPLPPVAANIASVTELQERGISRHSANKVVAACLEYLAAREEAGEEGEPWSGLRSWEDFWTALTSTAGLRHVGEKKIASLEAAGVYFGRRNLNLLGEGDVDELLKGCGALAAVQELLGDPDQPEGPESLEELMAAVSNQKDRQQMVDRLVKGQIFVAPRPVTDLNNRDLWTMETLVALPGIGVKTAEKIVKARAERKQGFSSWQEVGVKGAKLRALVRRGIRVSEPGSPGEKKIQQSQPAIVKIMEQKQQQAQLEQEEPTNTEVAVAVGIDLPELSPVATPSRLSSVGRRQGTVGTSTADTGSVAADQQQPLRTGPVSKQQDAPKKPSRKKASTKKTGQLKLEDTIPSRPESTATAVECPAPEQPGHQHWWQRSGQEELPFPLEFVECEEGGLCSRGSGKCVCLRGRYQYRMLCESERLRGKAEAEAEATRLHGLFPKFAPSLQRETESFRCGQTTTQKIRQHCWRDLLLYEATDLIPKKWRDTFRVDPYGNVVALEASSLAACAFEVDHIFPWCRGGLSVPINFMALYWGSNRHVKRDRIPNTFSENDIDRMQSGLSVDNFLELIAEGEAIEKRSHKQKYFQLVKHLLLSCIGLPSSLRAVVSVGTVRNVLLSHHREMVHDLMGVIQ